MEAEWIANHENSLKSYTPRYMKLPARPSMPQISLKSAFASSSAGEQKLFSWSDSHVEREEMNNRPDNSSLVDSYEQFVQESVNSHEDSNSLNVTSHNNNDTLIAPVKVDKKKLETTYKARKEAILKRRQYLYGERIKQMFQAGVISGDNAQLWSDLAGVDFEELQMVG